MLSSRAVQNFKSPKDAYQESAMKSVFKALQKEFLRNVEEVSSFIA